MSLTEEQRRVSQDSRACNQVPTCTKRPIQTSDAGFTFARGEATTTIWRLHLAEVPKSITVHAVWEEPRPLLTCLDVIREYGLVINYNNSRVYGHVSKRSLPCVVHSTNLIAMEMLPQFLRRSRSMAILFTF